MDSSNALYTFELKCCRYGRDVSLLRCQKKGKDNKDKRVRRRKGSCRKENNKVIVEVLSKRGRKVTK